MTDRIRHQPPTPNPPPRSGHGTNRHPPVRRDDRGHDRVGSEDHNDRQGNSGP